MVPAEREGVSLARRNRPAHSETAIMTGTFETPRRTTWRERLFVLAGPGLAALCTAASSALGTEFVAFAWIAAIAWTVLASLAAALWRGFRHGDWSAFRAWEIPEDGEAFDMDTRTGGYSHLRDWEDRDLHDDDHLR